MPKAVVQVSGRVGTGTQNQLRALVSLIPHAHPSFGERGLGTAACMFVFPCMHSTLHTAPCLRVYGADTSTPRFVDQ